MSQIPSTALTIVGRLTADPELRFTASGAPVANFTIAANDREYDKTTREWKDGPATFMRCSAWRQLAENITESLAKGSHVIAVGRLQQRSWETRDGEKRTSIELQVETIGPALNWQVATCRRSSGGGAQQQRRDDDPWGSAPAERGPYNNGPGSFGSADDDEPPF